MDIELKLREILLQVFGLDSIEEVKPHYSLVKDIGADSLDFVEIIHLIDRNFGVEITANSIMLGSRDITTENLFDNGKLTEYGSKILKKYHPEKVDRFFTGMTKIDLFSLITVSDLAGMIDDKRKEGKVKVL